METTLKNVRAEMEKTFAALKNELGKVRTGRASLTMLDEVRVDYYGTPTPLNQVATLGTPDPRLITIQPWEARLIPEIEKAILKSGLGVNPVNDGKLIRLNIPPLNEERRKELVKGVKKMGEDVRVAVRHHRHNAMESLKKLHDGKQISEDDWRRCQDQVQKITDESIKKIDQTVEHKEKDILSV